MASSQKEVKMNKYQQILADFLGDEQDMAEQEMSLDTVSEENNPEESNDVIDLDGAIVNLFTGNASPEKQQVIELAQQLDLDTETVEAAIYNMLSSFINKTEDVEEAEEVDGCPDCMEASKYAKTLIEFLKEEKEMKKAAKDVMDRDTERKERMLRELSSDLADLVESGHITEQDANKWLVDKQDQWFGGDVPKTADKKWTLSEVKNALEDAGSHFFSRKTLKFFGQSMRDFGVANVAGRVFIYSKRPNKSGTITFHEFLPSESRTRPLGKGFKHIDDVKDYLKGLKKGGGKEEQGCSESDGCGDSKYAKVIDSFLKVSKKDKPRLSEYGEVYKKTSSDGKATIVVRGIFGKGKPDSYHVRVLRGKGEHGDELDSPRKNVLYRDDVYLNPGETEKSILQKAIAIAEEWIKSEKGQKRLSKVGSVKKTKYIDILEAFLK